MLLRQTKAYTQSPAVNARFVDLFAGIGGFRLAFESLGAKCVFSSEWDKFSQDTYEANFGDRPSGDITQIDAAEIPRHDVLTAGFPCQPFSLAGVSKANSLGRSHGFEHKTQGTLFFDVCRIIKAHRPRAVVLKNVRNLVSHDGGNTLRTILDALEDDLGYHVTARSIWCPSIGSAFLAWDSVNRPAFSFPSCPIWAPAARYSGRGHWRAL